MKTTFSTFILILCITLFTCDLKGSSLPVINQVIVNNKLEAFRLHKTQGGFPSFSNFKYNIIALEDSTFNRQKPQDAMPFDAGFIDKQGNIYVSKPVSPAQTAFFRNDDQVVLYYLCQSYLQFYYQTDKMPLWFKVAFSAFEAHLDPPDSIVTIAVNAYGKSLSSFEVLNDSARFITNKGYAIAYAFGEFMSIYKNWGYPNLRDFTSTSINVAPWWWSVNTREGLLGDFNRYLYARFLEPDPSLRVKMYKETEHFRFYTREADKINYPAFVDAVEPAYTEYSNIFHVTTPEKLTFFSLPECLDAAIDDMECAHRITGGTAWSSGLHSSCASSIEQVPLFHHQNRHELAHVFQGLIEQGRATAWFNEGFPGFMDMGPFQLNTLDDDKIAVAKSIMQKATEYFGHRPNYEDTRVYPNPDYGYYTLGYYFLDFIYRKGGYQAIKNVAQNDTAAYRSMGYSTADAFLKDFYFDFEARIENKGIVTIKKPVRDSIAYTTDISVEWEPLDNQIPLDVYVSMVNDSTWTKVQSRTKEKSFSWNSGGFYGVFWLKFTAPDNLNIESVFGPFQSSDPQKLKILEPNGGEYLVAGDSLYIKWAWSAIPSINIQFTADKGKNWTTIADHVQVSSLHKKWKITGNLSDSCMIRIVDSSNSQLFDDSDSLFSIVAQNVIGGPYATDSNTVALFHFNNDLKNESFLSGDAKGIEGNITWNGSVVKELGTGVNTRTTLTLPHNSNLNLTGDWTIEAWVKVADLGTSYQYIIMKPGTSDPYFANYAIQINPYWNQIFYGFYFDTDNNRYGTMSMSPLLNEWYHIALIRDSKKKELRFVVHDKDRKLIKTDVTTFTSESVLLNANDIRICEGFTGVIDELRISNVVRTFSLPLPEKPDVPILSMPVNSSDILPETMNLCWNPSANAEKYRIQVSRTSDFRNIVLDGYVDTGTCKEITGLQKGFKYYWRINASNISGTSNWSAIWAFTRIIPVGSEDLKGDLIYRFYPNPADDYLQYNGPVSEDVDIDILTVEGKLIKSMPARENLKIDISLLTPGIYLVRLKHPGGVLIEKCLIH